MLAAQWEEVMKMGEVGLSPFDLLKHYVHLTRSHAEPGSALLRSLHPPQSPLSANAIGSLTRKVLASLGVDVKKFGPHSTRGAGVKMFKELGLSSEQVCQLGRWKNAQAFTAHYLRLNAAQDAGALVQKMVHKVSLGQSAESDWSWTPGTKDQGGKDQEDGAQWPSEPCSLLAGVVSLFSVFPLLPA